MKIRRKIFYSVFSAPFASKVTSFIYKLVLTFNAFNWQTRRKQEKIADVDLRRKRLVEEAIILNDSIEVLKNSLNNITDKEFTDNWEYRPVELTGFFDYSKEILVNRTKDSEPGYLLITPFYICKEYSKESDVVFVDRGWVSSDWPIQQTKQSKSKDLNKIIKIKGIIYKGDKKNRFSNMNHNENNKFFLLDPKDFSNCLNLGNSDISGEFLIRVVNFNSENKSHPIPLTKEDLMFWTITPQRHQDYANFWFTATMLNIASNIFVWCFL
jgi:cytochrome oxidase assembly protein ShyY1